MKVAISSNGNTLDAEVSPIFGRCANFLLVDTDTMQVEVMPNPAVGASGGAGIQAAQVVLRQGAEAVVSGNLGPNAMDVFNAAGIACYAVEGGAARQALAALLAGELQPQNTPTVAKDHGKGGDVSRGPGRGMGGGGMGGGRGLGRGLRGGN